MIRLGTRRSALATAQATWVADQLRGLGHEVELVPIVTTGDVNKAPLEQIGGTGVFVSALRDALLAARDRHRRALAQGPSDRAGRRPGHRRRYRCGRTRATCWSPATA